MHTSPHNHQETTSHIARNLRRPMGFAWTLLTLFWLMTSCSNTPTETITFKPGDCSPVTQLIENPLYIPHTLKAAPSQNKYASLFSEGFVHACLVSRWEWDTPDSLPPSDFKQEETHDHFALVKVLPTGKMQAVEPIADATEPIVTFPKGPLTNAMMVLYIVPNRIANKRLEYKDLCRQMQQASFDCFSAANRDKCIFYLRLLPAINPVDVLKTKPGLPQCQLCAPEVCDGKDNDCDGKVDNIYGINLPLVRPCYTGGKQTLLDETRGIGICNPGEQRCKSGKWDVCEQEQVPLAKEKCNNKDDNCEGTIDEDPKGELCPTGRTCTGGSCVVSSCRKGETSCGDACADLLTDRLHCGSCGTKCASGEICTDGKCVASCPPKTPTACPATQSNERLCVNTELDRNHCGKCGNQCPSGGICFEGKCVLSCPTTAPRCGNGPNATCCSLTCCNDTCIDISTNPEHCGGCAAKCPSGSLCFQSGCRVECPSFAPKCGRVGRELCCDNNCCNDACVNIATDRNNCGGCDVACKDGDICYDGKCILNCPTSAPACGREEQRTCCSLNCCGNDCTDTAKDRANCGGCGNKCKPGEICNGGTCILSCPTTAPECGLGNQSTCCSLNCCNNVCLDVKTDPNNCGACSKKCPGGQACQSGTCGFLCPPTQELCGNKCVDTTVNPNHCGKCGQACGAGERCEGGVCLLCPSSAPTCGTGTQRTCCSLSCCTTGTNAACIDTKNNPEHCGGCNNKCKTGERCLNGVCELCPPQTPKCGTACCSQSCCDNACIDTSYHPQHCGACGTKCQGGQTCCNGACIDLRADKDNCGKCGTKCSATKKCSQGVCCDNNETACGNLCFDLQTNQTHCGACGNACSAGQTCVAGKCNCPGNGTRCGNACVNTQTDAAHCGACANACHVGQTCQSGNCECPNSQSSCSNRCVNLKNNIAHCGLCNNKCDGGRTCQNGQCLCPANTTQCGNTCVNTQSDAQHCGGCGNNCPSGQICCGSCTDPLTNNANCGGCNNPCAVGKTCQNGSCQ